jgi:hypothetical protein
VDGGGKGYGGSRKSSLWPGDASRTERSFPGLKEARERKYSDSHGSDAGDWEGLDLSKAELVPAETGITFLQIGGPKRTPTPPSKK